ncbi:hypothetical protein, partial [Capnocytophaga cynodegmi]
ELENCFENNLIALEKQLVIVKSQLRKDQNVEWEHGGKVYRLNADNQIEEVQNVLSDQDIIAGNWTGEQEQKLRFYRDEKGTIQLKAFGYRKDLRIVKDKTADLEAVSKHILQQTNVYFKNLKDITQKAPQINDESFADGRKIAIDKDATYIRIFSEGVGITKTLLKTGEVESNVYLDKPKEKAFIKVPGTATGSVEAGVMAVTDITGTVVIIYDLATDETARKETYEGLVKIKDEIKENPSELFLILADVILEEATGLSADDWQKTQAQQTDKGEKSHLYSKGAVRSTITAVASGKLITKLPKMADDLAMKMKRSKDKLKKLNDFTKKTLDEKLTYIKEAWQKHYPEIFEERGFFEILMGEYCYKKAEGWVHTADIADNFKGIDFYKGSSVENQIFAKTAVSMKTTIVKDVNKWLNSKPIQDNIKFLRDGLENTDGLISNGKSMFITKAEIHIYIPKENINIREEWLKVLNEKYPEIEFRINTIDEFLK